MSKKKKKKENMSTKKKVLIGVTVVCAGGFAIVGGYFGIKYIKKLREDVDFVKFLVIESDCVPKALQNAENKLARQETKINFLAETAKERPNDPVIKAAIKKHEKEAMKLRYQIDRAVELGKWISDDDEIIYTK